MYRVNATDSFESDPFGELYLANGGEFGFTAQQIAYQLCGAAQGVRFSTVDRTSWQQYQDSIVEANLRVSGLMSRQGIDIDPQHFFVVQRGALVGEATLRIMPPLSTTLMRFRDGEPLRDGVVLDHRLDFWVSSVDNGLPGTVLACADEFLKQRKPLEGNSSAYALIEQGNDEPDPITDLAATLTNSIAEDKNGRFAVVICNARKRIVDSAELDYIV